MLEFTSKVQALAYASDHDFLAEFHGIGGTFHGVLIGATYPFLLRNIPATTKETKKHIILSLSGKAQAGKNTSADIIAKVCLELGSRYLVRQFSFADYLKRLASEQFYWNGDKSVYPPEVKDKGRNLLINLGKAYRDINPDFWANKVITEIESNFNAPGFSPILYIGTDTRFKNEILRLRELEKRYDNVSVFCLRISRPEELVLDNPSEHDLDNFFAFNRDIKNNGTLDDLKTDLSYLLTDLGVI